MYVIKHHNLWYIDLPSDSSWTIRKLDHNLSYIVGNGRRKTLFGLITGTSLGPCIYILVKLWCATYGGLYLQKVEAITHGSSWNCPLPRNRVTVQIVAATPAGFLAPTLGMMMRFFGSLLLLDDTLPSRLAMQLGILMSHFLACSTDGLRNKIA